MFSRCDPRLYQVFLEAFADWDGIVVLAAYNVDLSALSIPEHFIVRDCVPQHDVLKVAEVTITHCGMNSLNDFLIYKVPFVCLPLGADQPLLAARAGDLGATVILDAEVLTPRNCERPW